MALIKEMKIGNTGLTCDYLKVVGFVFGKAETKEKKMIDIFQIKLGIFLNKEAAENKLDPITTQDFNADLNELNGKGTILNQIYSYLKTRPELKGAKNEK